MFVIVLNRLSQGLGAKMMKNSFKFAIVDKMQCRK